MEETPVELEDCRWSGIWIYWTVMDSGKTSIKETLPEPSGMLLLLIGLLVTYTGLYAYLVTDGPLREES